jgi:hypothetical protein
LAIIARPLSPSVSSAKKWDGATDLLPHLRQLLWLEAGFQFRNAPKIAVWRNFVALCGNCDENAFFPSHLKLL